MLVELDIHQLPALLVAQEKTDRAAFAAAKFRLGELYRASKAQAQLYTQEKFEAELRDVCAQLLESIHAFDRSTYPPSLRRDTLRTYKAAKSLEMQVEDFVDGGAADWLDLREHILRKAVAAEDPEGYETFKNVYKLA